MRMPGAGRRASNCNCSGSCWSCCCKWPRCPSATRATPHACAPEHQTEAHLPERRDGRDEDDAERRCRARPREDEVEQLAAHLEDVQVRLRGHPAV